jgi:hypothetical protein
VSHFVVFYVKSADTMLTPGSKDLFWLEMDEHSDSHPNGG